MDLFDAANLGDTIAPYERLARKALAAYGLEEARLEFVSDTTKIVCRAFDRPAKSAWALHIHPRGWDSRRILRSLHWLAALRRDTDIPVPEPILTRSGELVQSLSTPGLSGFRQVTLVSWLAGQRRALDDWSREDARCLGLVAGRLHTHAERVELPRELAPPRRDIDWLDEAIDPRRLARTFAPDDEGLLAAAFDAAREAMADLGTSSDVAGLIHSRLTPEHVLFEEDVIRVVGFGQCRWDYYASDLAGAVIPFGNVESVADLTSALFEGYHDARPSSEETLNPSLIPPFAALHLLERLDACIAEDQDEDLKRRTTQRIVTRLRNLFG